MPDTLYAECEYCGPLPVYGDASPETDSMAHVFDTADEHVARLDHPVKIWQLVVTRIPGTAIRRIP